MGKVIYVKNLAEWLKNNGFELLVDDLHGDDYIILSNIGMLAPTNLGNGTHIVAHGLLSSFRDPEASLELSAFDRIYDDEFDNWEEYKKNMISLIDFMVDNCIERIEEKGEALLYGMMYADLKEE